MPICIGASMNNGFVFCLKFFVRKWVKGVTRKLNRKRKVVAHIKMRSSSYSDIVEIVGISITSVAEIAKTTKTQISG